jgi:thiosulfate reductase cytochrome b subunit
MRAGAGNILGLRNSRSINDQRMQLMMKAGTRVWGQETVLKAGLVWVTTDQPQVG